MGMKRLPLALGVVLIFAIAACTRTASPSDPNAQDLPFPTPGGTSEFPAMDILSTAAAATQTAQAGAPAATPIPTEEPTQAPQAATATPEATATSEAAPTESATPGTTTACQSPYTVQEGEWVYSIARKCGLDPNDIISVNGLRAPFLLYPGDKLTMPGGAGAPPPGTGTCASPYVVQLGEWVYSIARKCGTTAEAIISANSLAFPYIIYPGNELVVR